MPRANPHSSESLETPDPIDPMHQSQVQNRLKETDLSPLVGSALAFDALRLSAQEFREILISAVSHQAVVSTLVRNLI